MRKFIRQLLILFVLGYIIFTLSITYREGSPEKELEYIIMVYADNDDVTGVEICLDQDRVIHKNNNSLRDAIFRIVRGGVLDITCLDTVYNDKKNLARVDCNITRQGDNGPVTNRNYFYMCYKSGFGWEIYDIVGYTSAHQEKTTTTDEEKDDTAKETDNLTLFFDRATTYAECTEQEILDAVAKHYYNNYGVSDVLVRLDSVDGDIWLIQVYEDMGDHESTFEWYTIDRAVVCGITMLGQDYVDLSLYIDREPLWIYVDRSSPDLILYGHRTDGSSLDYGQLDDSSEMMDSAEQSKVNDIQTGVYVISEGRTYVGYEDGQILPGTYGLITEGDINKYLAYFKVQHKHSVVDSYPLGMAEGNDMLFNKGILDFYVKEGDYIDFDVTVGEVTVTIYQK